MIAPMFGPKLRTVFASRWKAIWFSASVLLTAYCSIPSSDQTGSVVPRAQQAHSDKSASPWALKPGEKPSHIIR